MSPAGFEPTIPARERLVPDHAGRHDTATVRDGRTAGVQALKVVQLLAVGTAAGNSAVSTSRCSLLLSFLAVLLTTASALCHSSLTPKLPVDIGEILLRADGNFEQRNKVLWSSTVIIINTHYNYIINA